MTTTDIQTVPPLDDGGTSLFGKTVSGLNALGSLLIVALVILINIEAFSRSLFNKPFDGVIELIEIGIVAIVFLQLADAARRKMLTQSDGLFNLALQRKPGIGRAMGIFINLTGVFFMALIIYGSVPLLQESWNENHYVGVRHLFTAPTWPIKFIIVLGATMTMIQFAIFTWSYISPAQNAGPSTGEGQ